jgi:hypothetical protein
MLNISSFFAKFKIIDGGRSIKIGEILNAINSHTKVNLNKEELVLDTKGNLRINTSPLRRNEIFLNKSIILSDLLAKGIEISELR